MSTVTSTPAAAAYSSSQYNYLNGTYFPTPFHLQQQLSQPYIGPAPPVYSAPASVPGVYTLPQYQQAQQLFQRVAQTITPEAIENVKAALANSEIEQKAEAKKKAVPRKAAGQTWEDPTLADWPENDYRIFCGNLGNEVNDDVLTKAFSRFPSFNMARVVRDKRTGKTKGYGFVSFSNPSDLVTALKEMNGFIWVSFSPLFDVIKVKGSALLGSVCYLNPLPPSARRLAGWSSSTTTRRTMLLKSN